MFVKVLGAGCGQAVLFKVAQSKGVHVLVVLDVIVQLTPGTLYTERRRHCDQS